MLFDNVSSRDGIISSSALYRPPARQENSAQPLHAQPLPSLDPTCGCDRAVVAPPGRYPAGRKSGFSDAGAAWRLPRCAAFNPTARLPWQRTAASCGAPCEYLPRVVAHAGACRDDHPPLPPRPVRVPSAPRGLRTPCPRAALMVRRGSLRRWFSRAEVTFSAPHPVTAPDAAAAHRPTLYTAAGGCSLERSVLRSSNFCVAFSLPLSCGCDTRGSCFLLLCLGGAGPLRRARSRTWRMAAAKGRAARR